VSTRRLRIVECDAGANLNEASPKQGDAERSYPAETVALMR
jgi:hypothetical protein